MSEQNKEKKTSSISTLIATAIVAAAAIAAIIVLIVMSNKTDGGQQNDLKNSLTVEVSDTQAFADECGENAKRLVQSNYRVVRLFISEGLPHRDEPYGNNPEDGYYTVESDEFKTLEEVEELLKSTFVEEEASRILMQMPSDPGAAYGGAASAFSADEPHPDSVAVYWSRVDYVDNNSNSASGSQTYEKQSVLGISQYFRPYTDYKKPWGSTSIRIVPVSEEECDITIYLGADKDVELSSVEDTDILTTKMVKVDGEWRLTKLVY